MDILTPSAYVNRGFEIIRPVLAGFVCRTLEKKNTKDW